MLHIYLPQNPEQIELDADSRARMKAFDEVVCEFRKGGSLEPVAVQKLRDYFRLQHIFHSTGIEGNRLDLRETEVLLANGLQINEKPLSDQLDVKDLNAAFGFLESLAESAGQIREVDLRELHRLAVLNRPEAAPGSYRQIGVVIQGSDHKPPEPLAVPSLMEELAKWLNEQKEISPLLESALSHHRLTAIHPFVDGNGRVARLLGNLILIRRGYPIVNIRREDRPRYYEALSFADLNLFSPLTELVLDRALEVFSEMKRVREETERAKVWAQRWGQKEAEVIRRREQREYEIWLGLMDRVRLEFENRADLLNEQLQTLEISFRSYPPPDLEKYTTLRERGSAPQTWFFSIRFRSQSGHEPQRYLVFRLFRDWRVHSTTRDIIPLQLNWFEDGIENPVNDPKIRFRELYYNKEKQLVVRYEISGKDSFKTSLTIDQIAQDIFDDVLKNFYGIAI